MEHDAPEGLRVPWSIKDAIVVFGLAWIGLPVATLLALARLGTVVPVLHQLVEAFKGGSLMASFVFVVIDALGALGIVVYYLKRYQASWRDLGLRRFNLWRAARYVAIIFVAFIVLVPLAFIIVSWLFPAFNAAQEQTNEFTKPANAQARHLSFVALVLLPPLVEEMVFRGFMFPAFAKRLGAVWGAVVTSLLFGLAHLQYNVGVYTVLLGLLLCLMYYKTRSIWPGIILHMLNNYLAFVVLVGK